jgi:hypothetical protein
LIVHGRKDRLLLVEEAGALAFSGTQLDTYVSGEEAFKLLESSASDNLAPSARDRFLTQARERVQLSNTARSRRIGTSSLNMVSLLVEFKF